MRGLAPVLWGITMFTEYHLTFEYPWLALALALVVVPLVWWIGFRHLAALGPGRRWLALVLRSLVVVLFVLAMAELRAARTSERLTVIYLLDLSQSIPSEAREAMIEYVNRAIEEHRKDRDRAGVIVFGRDAAIELPPFDETIPVARVPESPVDPEYTNLAAAMRLAQASFPEDAARRVVIVTDGNENLGNAMEQAQAMAAAGVGIDVVPVRYRRRGEVIVERLALPSDARRGQPLDLKVVVSNTRPPTAGDSGEVTGRLSIKRGTGDRQTIVSEERVTLPPGKRVFTVRQQIDAAGFFQYEATFTPDRPDDDTMPQNNRATTFTHIQGKGQVLLIENHEADKAGQYGHLVRALQEHNIEVTVRPSNQLFGSLAELQPFDSVVLANVPREHFTDAQIQMLVRNTQQMGAGLVMLGGPDSFGAGGWANTEIEKAMPVDFTIKSAKVVPRGALAMIMHASEIAQGNYWQKVIAAEALKALGPRDYCGVIHYGGMSATDWLWRPGMAVVGERRAEMLARLDRMTPGDMPDFDPGLILARKGLAECKDAGIRHLIIISDGDPSPPSRLAIQGLIDEKITVSSVAVGAHGPAESRVMENLATATGGKFYKVNNPQMLPRIFQREARKVAQPLIYENLAGFRPQIRFPHEMLNGIEAPLRPITGFVLTTRKEHPLVEVSLVSPQPSAEHNNTILASWTYGLGRAVALTTDGTTRWTQPWIGWEAYSKLMGQMVRWSMRPSGDQGKFTVATDLKDGQVHLIITALDQNDEFLNFLDFAGTVVGPDLQPIDLKIEQTAPGRYVATFPAGRAGSYLILATPGAGRAPIRTGINVPYSDEFRALETNEDLLRQMASLAPEGGQPGAVIEHPDGFARMDQLLQTDSFRHDLPKATSSQDAWYYLVLVASCLFFADVFVRRVQVSLAWLPRLIARLAGRKPAPAPEETIQ
ncbi:MAG: VWA domain-containing protein, partial [Thermoguttaceae bacterium]|nr:VWA domain-containing protein [Thermoguttaceae bacterium]